MNNVYVIFFTVIFIPYSFLNVSRYLRIRELPSKISNNVNLVDHAFIISISIFACTSCPCCISCTCTWQYILRLSTHYVGLCSQFGGQYWLCYYFAIVANTVCLHRSKTDLYIVHIFRIWNWWIFFRQKYYFQNMESKLLANVRSYGLCLGILNVNFLLLLWLPSKKSYCCNLKCDWGFIYIYK